MNVYSEIAEKMQRALRRGGGCTLTNAQLVALLRSDAWIVLAKAERDELLAQYGGQEPCKGALAAVDEASDSG